MKKRNNKLTTVLLVLVLGIAAVGVLGFVTKGFKDFNIVKTSYEKQIEKYDIKENEIKEGNLSFDEKTNQISSMHYVYINDDVDVKTIEVINTYTSTYLATYDMTAIRKSEGAYRIAADQFFHYEDFVIFAFTAGPTAYKLKTSEDKYLDLDAISYITTKLVVPLKVDDSAKSIYQAQIETKDVKDTQIKGNKLTFNKEDNTISQDSTAVCFLYIHDSTDVKSIEMPNTYGETYASSYDMATIRKANGAFKVSEDSAVHIYHYEDYTVFKFQGATTTFKLKASDGKYLDLAAISYATTELVQPSGIDTF